MDKGREEPVKGPGAHSADHAQVEKRSPLQARWTSSLDMGQVDKHTERPVDANDLTASTSASKDTASVNPPPASHSADSSAKTPDPDKNTPLHPSQLIHQLRDVAASLVQLAQSLEQLENVLHAHSDPLPPKEPSASNLSQLVKDRPDLQALLRQYLFK
ncbi:hypothetical protein [Sulfobacillus thermosulfidooxidans]|uniref:hypothetical protein n=1 Tax=Sulfobacillus thermosulfidooxidans TaxID=28034 RepID=UPI00096BA8EF|nr:hypothetical protein [Sulfobacillus thermosulfidooxidans]OLZ08266.1 hypothetical protein BFX05_04295 [Sulfobacillus thermosulfidooxidans]OLZ13984.1 hypothetical protein BFX06_06645 [Sulfobacillus thermosulfidooxidans]OLZ19924.1 hypothetical protein BFX07_02215 [Sulfobacillus thermosulfidooxidans]